MNKYEQLFDEILSQAQSGRLKWKQLRRQANSDIIFDPCLVYRQYSAELQREGGEFTVLLVEKKYDDPESDFAYQRRIPELLILDEGELVTRITDSIIERTDMYKLINIVETRSDKAQKLFGA